MSMHGGKRRGESKEVGIGGKQTSANQRISDALPNH
jgi:hypothetical protein